MRALEPDANLAPNPFYEESSIRPKDMRKFTQWNKVMYYDNVMYVRSIEIEKVVSW